MCWRAAETLAVKFNVYLWPTSPSHPPQKNPGLAPGSGRSSRPQSGLMPRAGKQ